MRWALPLVLLLLQEEGPFYHATFSIVCRDPKTGEFAVGVTTMPRAVRKHCPFVRPGVGAVTTQALTNSALGPRGLDLMAEGKSPEEALKIALGEDQGHEQRQVAYIDGKNPPAAHTGAKCMDWAGHLPGKDFCAQGNILVSRQTLEQVAKTFEETPGSLCGRVIAALKAGQKAGGDKRGHSSCAVLVASKDKVTLDLFVDNHKDPVNAVAEKFLPEHMRLGDRELAILCDPGPDVKELEQKLKMEADDTFDEKTVEAVKAFQKSKKLPQTGKADLATIKEILK